MTNIDKLKHFMEPYYQEASDLSLLQDYLDEYTHPECAASALWYELKGKIGFDLDGVRKIATGAEKFEYSEIGTMQLACDKNGKYYQSRCEDLAGNGSAAIKVSKADVGGIESYYGSSTES